MWTVTEVPYNLTIKCYPDKNKRTTKYLTLSLFSYKNENCAKESTKGKTLINGKIKLMEEIHKCSYILFGWADESIYKFGLSILHFTIFPNFLISLTHGIKALFIYRSWGSSLPFICVMDEKMAILILLEFFFFFFEGASGCMGGRYYYNGSFKNF